MLALTFLFLLITKKAPSIIAIIPTLAIIIFWVYPVAASSFIFILFSNLHFITWPSSVISKLPVSVVVSYPLGACVSEILYFPANNLNLFPSFDEVNSITLPLSNPSKHSIFICAPSNGFPVVTSTNYETDIKD